MAKIETSVQIAAPAELVFAFFVPQRMPYWYGYEMKAEFEILGGASDFASGQKVRIAGKLGAQGVSLTAVVTRYEFGRTLEWQFQDQYGVKGKQSWEIAPQNEAAIVHMRDEYEIPGRIARIADALITRHAVARRDRGWLARLARLAERR